MTATIAGTIMHLKPAAIPDKAKLILARATRYRERHAVAGLRIEVAQIISTRNA